MQYSMDEEDSILKAIKKFDKRMISKGATKIRIT